MSQPIGAGVIGVGLAVATGAAGFVAGAVQGDVTGAAGEVGVPLIGLYVAHALLRDLIDVLRRGVDVMERVQREGVAVRHHHDHGDAVGAVSGLGAALERHAEATMEVDPPPQRVKRAG